jgi:hypothetical protein
MMILGFHSFAFLTMLAIGHWPSYGNPDPKTLGWPLQLPYLALAVGIIFWPATPILATCLAVFGGMGCRSFPSVKVILAALGSATLFLLFARFDPTGVLTWFMD